MADLPEVPDCDARSRERARLRQELYGRAPGPARQRGARWDYRIVVTFTSANSLGHEAEVLRALFPDKATRQREETRRWELTLNHWDLPIREIDPHADPE